MSRYAVREICSSTDADSVCALWARNLESGDYEHARNKLHQGYVANPAATGTLFAISEDADSTVAGVIGLHPRRFFMDGREWLAATLADFAVDQEHRSAGPALMLMRTALHAGRARFSIIFGIPNSQSSAICRRAGMTSLGTLTRYTLVGSSRGRLALRIKPVLLPVVAPLLDLGLRARLFWKGLSIRPVLTCRGGSFDDAALDSIWERRTQSLLLSDRSAAMLRWRYCRNEPTHWRVALMQDAQGVDCGYVIWRLEAGLAVISDFFSTEPARLTAPLLQAFAKFAFAAGAHSISASFFGSEPVSSAFAGAGFFLAETQGNKVLIANDSTFGEVTPARCYLTAYDNDD